MEDWTIEFQPWGGWIGAAIAIIVAVFAVFLLFKRATVLPMGKFTALIVLRLMVLLLFSATILRLGILTSRETFSKQPLTIAVDQSTSMLLKASSDSPTRWDILEKYLENTEPRFSQLAAKYDIEWVNFDSQIHPYSRLARPNGTSTAIGDVMAQWRTLLGPGVPGSLLLLSDGCNNRGADPLEAAAHMKIEGRTVYCVGIGERETANLAIDASVEDLILPFDVNAGQRFAVEAMLRFKGLGGGLIDVEMLVDGLPVLLKTVEVLANDVLSKLVFESPPVVAGNHLITVRISPITMESSTENNTSSAYLKVKKGIGRVLLVEGNLRYEYLFLRRTLSTISGIEFDTRIVRGVGKESIPLDSEMWRHYSLIILGDVPAHVLGSKNLDAIAAAVRNGTALLTLGGLNNYGAGGYDNSPLSSVLPFAVSNVDVQSMAETTFLPSLEGTSYDFLQIFDTDLQYAELREKYRGLPKLSGYIGTGKLKPTATILAQNEDGKPLMVQYLIGTGKVLSFLTDTTFHWAFNGLRDDADTLPLYKRFWRRIILNLIDSPGSEEYNVDLSVETTTPSLFSKLPITLTVTDKEKHPVKDSDVILFVVDAEGRSTPIKPTMHEDHWTGEFSPASDGHYTITALAKKDGKSIGSDEVKILATMRDRETANPDTDFSTLSSLAAMTGGSFAEWSKSDAIFVSLLKRADEYRKVMKIHEPIWASPWLFLTALFFLSLEWTLRRRKGLP